METKKSITCECKLLLDQVQQGVCPPEQKAGLTQPKWSNQKLERAW